MSAPDSTASNPCGCSKAELVVASLFNRSGLAALACRIGIHPTFLRRMLARIPIQTVPPGDPNGARPLAALTTRAGDDPSIALLDAWAAVADVLTFYQERIANEGYLRTATERRSVLELARAIGYELKPGVAAGVHLAFTIDDAPGAPKSATIPQRTKVQSVPGQDQLPQTFETTVAITARVDWNALRPRLKRPQELAVSQNRLYMLGLSTSFATGAGTIPAADLYPLDPGTVLPAGNVPEVEVKQVYIEGTATNLKAGDLLLLAGKKGDEVRTSTLTIRRVEADETLRRTRLDLAEQVQAPSFMPLVYAPATFAITTQPFIGTSVQSMVVAQAWQEPALAAFLSVQGWSGYSLLQHIQTAPVAKLPPADSGVFAFRAKLGLFGHNAPHYNSLPDPAKANLKGDPYPHPWDPSGWEIWKDSITGGYYTDADIYAERTLPGVLSNTWAVLERPGNLYSAYRVHSVSEASLTGFALSAKATGLKLSTPKGVPLEEDNKPADFKVRRTTLHAQSERLELAQMPIEEAVSAGSTSLQLDSMVLGLEVDQPLIITGERDDLAGVSASEVVTLSSVSHSGGYTTLSFRKALQYSYVRKTVTLNANVAAATHGETVKEVLGSGDGTQAYQQFVLKKQPLTHVSAATAGGSQSTLEIRVNDVLWTQVPRLLGLDENSENYVVQIGDNGKATVIFGDGKAGARLPTGTENVAATYRSGIGRTGMVAPDQLTLLQSRPLGVRGVANPLAASGAEDPESRDSARSNAPLAVLTLDRIVSLRDFEDFARAFAGVGKAQAVPLWKGETRLVHITVAASAAVTGSGGASALATYKVDPESDLYKNLVDAVHKASDPAQQFIVDTYQPLFFNVKAKVAVNPRYEAAPVLAAVTAALKSAFCFERRNFGQPVTAAEVMSVIQSVPGVIATDLDQFYQYQQGEPPPAPTAQITPPMLEVVQVREIGDQAGLLLINPVGIQLEEMKP